MANTHSIDLERSSSQYLEVANANCAGLQLASDFTFEYWIKLEQLPSTAGGNFYIFAKRVTSAGYWHQIDVTSNKLQLLYSAGTSTNKTWHTGDTAFDGDDVGEWVHIAAAVDVSAKVFYFYKNGVLMTETATGDNGAVSVVNDPTAPFTLGASNAHDSFFDGLIDDFRVWSDIRTEQEIQDNMNTELTGSEDNLVAYYKFNNDATDTSGTNSALTLYNSPSYSEDRAFGITKIYTSGAATSLPTDTTDLSNSVTTTDVDTDDDTYVKQSAQSQYPIFLFKRKSSNSQNSAFSVVWKGKSNIACSEKTIYLQIYNTNSTTWENLDSDNTTAANTEFTLTGEKTSPANYWDGNGYINCRVYQDK